jgi:branched-chain amino acid transport system substrate-binding protein
MKKLIIIVIAAILLWPLAAWTQTLPDQFEGARKLSARGLQKMRDKDYPAAIDAFRELASTYKNSRYRDIYNYELARAYYYAGEFDPALQVLASFNALFPNSYLLPYAHLLRANSDYRVARLEDAFLEYILAYRTADDRRLRELSRQSLLAMVEAGYIPPDSTLGQVPAELSCPIKGRVAFDMADRWGDDKIAEFLAGCPAFSAGEEQPPKRIEGRPLIGITLPLSGPYAKYGQSILDGAMLADELLQESDYPVELLAYDTRADNIIAAREALLLADAEADIIVGPLLSDVAATVSASTSCSGVPLLVPAATEAGFSDLSPGCFQMSTNVETIGRGMAQYAVRHRGMTTLAAICPATIDEMTMADAFADEAKRLGAHVLAVERFRPGETDFGPYINDIKEAILGPPQDSVFYITLEGDTLKEGEAPVSFDGLFIPATEDQLFLLLPQLQFYRVTTSYLGTDEWNTPKVLKLGTKILKDAVFYSSRAAMQNAAGYDKFAAAYDAKHGAEPDRLAAVGYDAINLLAAAYRAGKKTRAEITGYLSTLEGYEGASGKITFGRDRTNLQLPLFTFTDDQVRPILEQPTVEEPAEEEFEDVLPDSVGVEVIKEKP